MSDKEKVDLMLLRLSKSKFRSNFHLRKYMIKYVNDRGMETIENHAKDFINKKIGNAKEENDGRQTPTKNHPVFIAMHATSCCCRGCLYKWHNIPQDRPLTEKEKDYLILLVMTWIKNEMKNF